MSSRNKTNEMYLVLNGRELTPDKCGESEILAFGFANLEIKVRGVFRKFPELVCK
jgi:hypothetical protein